MVDFSVTVHKRQEEQKNANVATTIDGSSHINNDNNNKKRSKCIFQDIFHLMPCDNKFHLRSFNIILAVVGRKQDSYCKR